MNEMNETVMDQRSLTGGAVFRFCERHLAYSGNEWDFKIKYEDIAGPSQYLRRASSDWPTAFALFYLLVLALVLLQTRAGQYPQYGLEGLRALGMFAGIFIGVLITICGLTYYLTHKDYTVVPTRNGNILVIRGGKHDEIISKLQTKRLEILRLLSAPDPANSPGEETAKLNWLREEGAITAEEYQRLCPHIAG